MTTDNQLIELAQDLEKVSASLRRAQEDSRDLERHRNRLVRQALAEGWSDSQLARISGLSRGRIWQLNKTTNSA